MSAARYCDDAASAAIQTYFELHFIRRYGAAANDFGRDNRNLCQALTNSIPPSTDVLKFAIIIAFSSCSHGQNHMVQVIMATDA